MSAFDEFADDRRWVAWVEEDRNGKPTKVPYGSRLQKARADDPGMWRVRASAEQVAAKLVNGQSGGIGIMLGDLGCDTFLAGVDLDTCIDADGCLAPWAERVLGALPTYAETSPSGTGVKAFFYILAEEVRPFLDLIGVDRDKWGTKRGIVGLNGANHGPGVEIYLSHRYFAVTERLLPGKPDRISMLDWEQLKCLAQLILATAGNDPQTQRSRTRAGRDTSRSAKALGEGARLRRDGKTFEEMVLALRTHSDPEIRDWVRDKGEAYNQRELRRIWERCAPAAPEYNDGVSLDDFWAYMPMHNYIFAPTRMTWPGASVNSRIPPISICTDKAGKEKFIPASAWLDQHKPIEQMTWAPGLPMVIEGKLIIEGGWIPRVGLRCFNLYHPPTIIPGDVERAGKWLDHVRYVFPDDADHILDWLAHRVQQPQDKINHALVLGGAQGIGKDTMLEPVKYAVGPWNFQEVSPTQILGRFNGFLKSVILRVSEARDLGEFDRFQLYDHMKAYTAAPPDVLRVDEKHLREFSIINCCGVIITTNHKTDGIFLPADDRRHYIAWSDRTKKDQFFQGDYWDDLWAYYANGGLQHVAAFLLGRDLGSFNAKAPPPNTAAFWAIVDAGRAPEESELADALDRLGYPVAVTLAQIQTAATDSFVDWIGDRKNRRIIPHRLERCGYAPVRNPTADDGLWKINGRRQAVYAQTALSFRAQIDAARQLPGQ
jgi:hypothetical protein